MILLLSDSMPADQVFLLCLAMAGLSAVGFICSYWAGYSARGRRGDLTRRKRRRIQSHDVRANGLN